MAGRIVNATRDIHSTDVIIAFFGPTGSGKSFFIDLLTGELGRRSGNSLKSVTSGIEATRMLLPDDPEQRHIVLVDTPGFDNTTRSDMQVLRIISEWLTTTYEAGVKLSGLIYLHRITDYPIAGSLYKNLHTFGELCGDLVMTQVALVSTMWGKVNFQIGCDREKELKENFWKDFINKGSSIDRLQDTSTEAAWDVVLKLVRKRLLREDVNSVLLQEEMVDNGTKLHETQAGKTLYNDLQKNLAGQKETMASLLARLNESDDPQLVRELRKEYERIQKEFDRTFDDAEKLRISLLKRMFGFLFTKKTKPKPIKIGPGA